MLLTGSQPLAWYSGTRKLEDTRAQHGEEGGSPFAGDGKLEAKTRLVCLSENLSGQHEKLGSGTW